MSSKDEMDRKIAEKKIAALVLNERVILKTMYKLLQTDNSYHTETSMCNEMGGATKEWLSHYSEKLAKANLIIFAKRIEWPPNPPKTLYPTVAATADNNRFLKLTGIGKVVAKILIDKST